MEEECKIPKFSNKIKATSLLAFKQLCFKIKFTNLRCDVRTKWRRTVIRTHTSRLTTLYINHNHSRCWPYSLGKSVQWIKRKRSSHWMSVKFTLVLYRSMDPNWDIWMARHNRFPNTERIVSAHSNFVSTVSFCRSSREIEKLKRICDIRIAALLPFRRWTRLIKRNGVGKRWRERKRESDRSLNERLR